MSRDTGYNVLICILLYLICSSIPFDLIFNDNLYLVLSLQILLQVGCLIFLFFFFCKNRYIYNQNRIKIPIILLFIPLLMVCASNYFYPLFDNNSFYNTFNDYTILRIVLNVFICVNEELIFRYLLLNNVGYESKIKRILVSSAIFGLLHITRFLASFNPIDLLPILYAFGLGIILGFIYEYSHSLTAAIIFHILFNVLNDVIFSSLFVINTYWIFIVISIVVALIAGIYLFLIYWFILRRPYVE